MTCHNSYAQLSMISLCGAHGRAPGAGVPRTGRDPPAGFEGSAGPLFCGPLVSSVKRLSQKSS
jgi:hypothetical protein